MRTAVLEGGGTPVHEVYTMPKLLEERHVQAQARKKEEREVAWAAAEAAKKVGCVGVGVVKCIIYDTHTMVRSFVEIDTCFKPKQK